MQDYRVELDVYHGPLDLLLFLIRRDEIEINDIPIHHITEQYLQFVRTIERLDINVAGEFLVMAASLMEIKSAMLTPPPDVQEAGEEALPTSENPADPRYELVRQLLAYKRFKDAAYQLDDRREQFEARFPRRPAHVEPDQTLPSIDLEDVQVWDLLEAFNRLMEQTAGLTHMHEVTVDDTPIELHAADIVDRLQRDGAMTLQRMFEGRRSVGEMLGLFLATLELIRQRRISARQSEQAGQIDLVLLPQDQWLAVEESPSAGPDGEPAPAPVPVHHDPKDVDAFDWPDEQTRARYLRRQERRARGEFIEEDAQFEQDLAELESQQVSDEQ